MTLTLANIEDLALQTWINLNPSTHWANQQVEPYRGLPFGRLLHHGRAQRPRALTLPLERLEAGWWHRVKALAAGDQEQITIDQTQSGFLSKLPIDIRLIIYDMVLGGNMLHLTTRGPRGGIYKTVCQHPNTPDDQSHHVCCSPDQSQSIPDNPFESTDTKRPEGLLSLLLTCRRVYSEAVDVLYHANTFEFTQHLAAFTFLCQQIPPQRLPRIRRLRLHMRLPRHPCCNTRSQRDWNDLWIFFQQSMPGLQHLYLRLQMLQPVEEHIASTNDDDAESWLRPMVELAVYGKRSRGLELMVDIRRIKHNPSQIFHELAGEQSGAGDDALVKMTCAVLHERIRVSLSQGSSTLR